MLAMLIILTVFTVVSVISNTMDMIIYKEDVDNTKILTTGLKSLLASGSIATMVLS